MVIIVTGNKYVGITITEYFCNVKPGANYIIIQTIVVKTTV